MNTETRPVHILLIDDDEINNFISIKLIKKALANAEISACLNGKIAIDELTQLHKTDPNSLPDFILLRQYYPLLS